MKLAVTGASGFVGRRLCALAAERGHAILRIGRSSGDRLWDPASGPAPLGDVDGVVHLAGDPVAEGRWTKSKMARIRDSRILGTRNLVAGMKPGGPRVLVSASAIGLYGDRGDEVLTEDSPPGSGFLADTCRDWEAEASRAPARTALVRISIVLGAGGGALGKMLLPFRLCLGGTLAGGRQWMSWIHLDDLCGLILHAAETESVSGPLLAASPEPVTNAVFTGTLARVLGRPAVLPMPYLAMRLAFGKVAAVLASSQRCRPDRTLASGFAFRHPVLEPALRDLLPAP